VLEGSPKGGRGEGCREDEDEDAGMWTAFHKEEELEARRAIEGLSNPTKPNRSKYIFLGTSSQIKFTMLF
jgi:hypothetical protein